MSKKNGQSVTTNKAEVKTEVSNNSTREHLLEQLLAYESEVRNSQSLRELIYCLANETLQLTNGSQIFVTRPHKYLPNKHTIDVASNLSSIDRNAPAVVHLEQCFSDAISEATNRAAPDRINPFQFQYFKSKESSALTSAVILPIYSAHGSSMSAIVIAGDNVNFSNETPVLMRVSNVTQHAWRAFLPGKRRLFSGTIKRAVLAGCFITAVLCLFIKVPLSTLAPVELMAKNPQIVAAPMNGVIDQILISANTQVEKGTNLFTYVDTVMVADLKVAEQKRAVANAKLQTAQQNSFGRGEGRRDIAVAEAELKLADAELTFAEAQYERSVVKSPVTGIAIFNRKSDWQGKPVSVGERILEISDTAQVEARIDLAVSDSIVIDNGARVQLFLDSNPLTPLEGVVTSSAYRAEMDNSNQLSFKLFAKVEPRQGKLLRVGARGTAQVYGENVTLAFYLFRRPLSAMRQWIGW